MFKTKRLNLDSAGSGKSRIVDVRGSSTTAGIVQVRHSDSAARSSRSVPSEYRTLSRKRRGPGGFIVFLLILIVASASAYWYLSNQAKPVTSDSVALTVTGNPTLVSGQEIVYQIDYTNKDVITMQSVSLDVQWPDGFYFNTASVNPTSDAATTWHLGPLDPGQQKHLEIHGQLVGAKGSSQSAIFRLSYRPDNINSDFETSQTVATAITDAQLDVTLTGSAKVIAGTTVDFVAHVANITGATLSQLNTELLLPKDFDLISVEPVLTNNHWTGDVPADKPLDIKVKAKVADDAQGSQSWAIDITQTVNAVPRKLYHAELDVTVIRPQFGFELKVNGATGDTNADYGKTLNYQLKMTNQSDTTIEGARVAVLMDSDVLDRASLQTTGLAKDQTITWTKDQVAEFASFAPKQEVLLSWQITVLAVGTAGRASVDNVVTATIDGLDGWKQNSPVTVVTIGQGLVFNQGLYWNLGGEQVGSGNLPPVTNERSIYEVIWSIDTGNQDFDSVNISTTLPPKVSYVSAGDVDEGAIRYDAATNRLEWQIDSFSTKLLPLKAAFMVKLIPVDADKGSVMTVMNPASIVASGTQTFQAKSFSLTTDKVITTQSGDVGTVIE